MSEREQRLIPVIKNILTELVNDDAIYEGKADAAITNYAEGILEEIDDDPKGLCPYCANSGEIFVGKSGAPEDDGFRVCPFCNGGEMLPVGIWEEWWADAWYYGYLEDEIQQLKNLQGDELREKVANLVAMTEKDIDW